MKKFFISYSRDDKHWAYELWRALRDRMHLDVWIDLKLLPATDWWLSIVESIEECDCFIIVLTPKSGESIYCTEELNYAVALNKPILPIMLKNCASPKVLRHIQYENATGDVPMGDLLLTMSMAFNRIQTDISLGKYPKPTSEVERPTEPIARDAASLYELISQAVEALEVGNHSLAEQFCDRVIQADPLIMGEVASLLLVQIKVSRARAQAYESVKRLLAGSPAIVRTAPSAWRKLIQHYGADPDPDDLAAKVKALEEVIVPPPPDPLQAALARAREFSKTGQRNKDWTLFPVVFNTLQIPDMLFCLVPTGTFQMGSNDGKWKDEQPVHAQTFTQPFYIAQTQVTNVQWALGVKAGVVKEPVDADALKWYKDPKMANMPVVGVSWFECQKFAQWAGCRLPTEREWEYSARGIESLCYPWGNDWDATKPVWSENSGGQPNDVTSKPEGVSWVGAYHLSGNVWEWTGSLYEPYAYVADGTRERDTGDRTGVLRVLRGGSWDYDSLGFFRAACRNGFYPFVTGNGWGFRLARS